MRIGFNKFIAAAFFLVCLTGAQTLPTNQLYDTECDEGFVKLFTDTGATPTLHRTSFNNEWVNYVQNQTTTTALASGWSYDTTNHAITKTATPNDIRSTKQYANFDWRLQYKSNGNSGLYYRGTLAYSTAWASGMEVGIDNDLTVKASWTAGAAYDLYEPSPSASQVYIPYAAATTAGWNEIRVIAIGDSVEHWLNGVRVVKFKYFSADYNARYALSKWNASKQMGYATAGNQSAGPILRGYLGLQGDHQGNFFVRNIRIDTTPSWTVAYHVPTAVCSGTSISGKKSEGKPSMSYTGGKLAISIPNEAIEEAVLLDVFGRTQMRARINAMGGAEFLKRPEQGVYFLRYKSGGAFHSVRLGLIASN